MTRSYLHSRRGALPTLLRVAMFLACGVTAGCGDDPCEEAVADLCDKACSCDGGAACALVFGEGLSLGFDSAGDCEALMVQGCDPDVEDNIDGEACGMEVSGAMCTEMGLDVPDACGGG